jgi:chromosome segregation ATPase
MTLAELLSLLAVGVSLFAILSQRRYVSAQAKFNESKSEESSVDTALQLRSEMKIDRDSARSDYKKLIQEFGDLEMALESARQRSTELMTELENIKRRISQLDLMFNSLLKGAWILVAQVRRLNEEPDYVPPKEYITGPLNKDKHNE